jgi:hypothetical protein
MSLDPPAASRDRCNGRNFAVALCCLCWWIGLDFGKASGCFDLGDNDSRVIQIKITYGISASNLIGDLFLYKEVNHGDPDRQHDRTPETAARAHRLII